MDKDALWLAIEQVYGPDGGCFFLSADDLETAINMYLEAAKMKIVPAHVSEPWDAWQSSEDCRREAERLTHVRDLTDKMIESLSARQAELEKQGL